MRQDSRRTRVRIPLETPFDNSIHFVGYRHLVGETNWYFTSVKIAVWEACYIHWEKGTQDNRYISYDDSGTWMKLYNYYWKHNEKQ